MTKLLKTPARTVVIEIKGDSGGYTATINRIIERHRKLTRQAKAGAAKVRKSFKG